MTAVQCLHWCRRKLPHPVYGACTLADVNLCPTDTMVAAFRTKAPYSSNANECGCMFGEKHASSLIFDLVAGIPTEAVATATLSTKCKEKTFGRTQPSDMIAMC